MTTKQIQQPTPFQKKLTTFGMRLMSTLNVWVYKLSKGKYGSRLFGVPVCLLTMKGRKSGQIRTVALLYIIDGPNVVLVASKGGFPDHPVWYLNLVANPECTVQIGPDIRKMRARTANPQEKAALWPRLTSMYQDYENYQNKTERDIPVVILEPTI